MKIKIRIKKILKWLGGGKKRKLFFSLFLILLIILPVYFIFFSKKNAEASWWNEAWRYRKSIVITNNGTAQSNAYITLTLDTSDTTKFQSDCGDIRFTKNNGSLIPYYIVSGCGTATTSIHVNFDTLIAGAQTIYFYYGNPMAENGFSQTDFSTEAITYVPASPGVEEKSPAPVGYWSFDEGYGTTAHDESSSKNDGAISGATWKSESECVSGKCLFFDGNSTVSLGDKYDAAMLGDFSVSIWFKEQAVNTDWIKYLFFKGNNGSPYFGIGIAGSLNASGQGKIEIRHNNDVPFGYSTSNTYADNKWHHIVVARNDASNEVKLYIDGRLDSTFGDITFVDSGGLNIGSSAEPGRYFDGFIDEPKIYDYARTADQIKQDYNAGLAGVEKSGSGASVAFGDKSDKWMTDGLVGHWKMDEVSGATVADSSGNGNNGTLNNARIIGTSDASGNTTTTLIDSDNSALSNTTDDIYNGMVMSITSTCGSIDAGTQRMINDYTATTRTFTLNPAFGTAPNNCSYEIKNQVSGKFGNGIDFDGVDDGVTVVDSNNTLDMQGDFSISFWSKPETSKIAEIIAKKEAGNFEIYQNSLDLNIRVNGLNSPLEVVNYFVLNEWVHTMISYDKTQGKIKLYKNGILLTVGDNNNEVSINDYNLNIGAYQDGQYGFDGKIDEVRIYNRALSPDEVKKLYEYAPGPVVHWKIDEKVSGDSKAINDTSSYGNDGVTVDGANNTGMNCAVSGKYGSACQFDGTDDHILDTSANFFGINRQGSISVWAYPEFGNDGAYHFVVDTRNSSGNFGFGIGKSDNVENNDLGFGWRNGATNNDWNYYDFNWDNEKNKWHHFAMTWDMDTTTKKCYIDGVEVCNNTSAANFPVIDSIQLTVGRTGAGNYYFDGNIDDVRVYNYPRTQKQILEDMNGGAPTIKTPILDLSFDEGVGDVAHNDACKDASQCVSTGTLVSGATGTNTTSTAMWNKGGKFGGAMEFDGVDDYVSFLPISSGSDISLSAWVNVYENVNNHAPIIEQGGTRPFRLIKYFNRFCFGNDSVADNFYCTENIFSSFDAWCHILAVYDGNYNIFVNGIKYPLTQQPGIYNSWGTAQLNVGYRPYSVNVSPLSGKIDEVKIYNYALGEDEIKTLYNNSSGTMALGGEKAIANNNGSTVTGEAAKYCIPGDSAKCDKPVLELKMDEKNGTTAYDTSGNGNNGTLTNGPIWERGKNGSAIKFDGVNDYVNMGNPESLQITGELSVASWIYSRDCISGVLLDKLQWGAGGGGYGIGIAGASKNFGFWIRDDGVSFSATTAANTCVPNRWTHLAVTYDNNYNYKIFVNGVATKVGIATKRIGPSNRSLFAGSDDPWSGDYLDGFIDDLKVYNYARTPAQIAWDYNRGKPIAHWKMDEGEGAIVHDESGNGNNGTMTNMDAATDWVAGKNNKALDFDGTNDYLNIGDKYDYSHADDFSMSAWIKTNDLSGLEHIMGRDFQSYRLFKDNGQLSFRLDSNNVMLSSGSFLNVTDWFHIAATYSGTTKTAKIFVNGILKSEDTDSSLDWTGAYQDFSIGNSIGESYYFNGQIDDVKIYNYALTPEQIKQDYAGGAVNFK